MSVLRLVTLVEITTSRSPDATYTSAQIVYWSTVEVNASISCACIMTLKPLIQRWFPKLLSGSQHARDRSLRWITPLNSTRNSRRSFMRPGTQNGANHQRTASGSEKNHHLPPVDEKETIVCEEGLKSPDLEAQRHGSVSTVVCDDDSSIVGMSALRAPPKAHLRLSIHVTKSVHISKYPESPTPGQVDHRDKDFEDEYPGRLGPGSDTARWSEQSTMVVGKDWALEAESKK